jgi:hypothetical protein
MRIQTYQKKLLWIIIKKNCLRKLFSVHIHNYIYSDLQYQDGEFVEEMGAR